MSKNEMEVTIKVVDLNKKYELGKDNFVYALRGASCEIKQGEMVAIMGPSGSGKSTLMHLIGCLDKPDDGQVWLGGKRVDKLTRKQLTRLRSQEMGFIFQGFNLITTMTAIENVALAAQYAGDTNKVAYEKAVKALKLVGLGDRLNHSPHELSGGQQQRVAIARAIINKPRIILGDEPTGDLDTATSTEIIKMMREINIKTKTTFLLVTHNPEVAESCDRTIHMRDGKVIEH